MGIGEQMYINSFNDIRKCIEHLEYYKGLKRKYKYTKIEQEVDLIILYTKNELDSILQVHYDIFDEKIDVVKLTELVKGIGMKIEDAKIIIDYIDKTGFKPKGSEKVFFDSIRTSTYKHLTQKQATWLNDIYYRATL